MSYPIQLKHSSVNSYSSDIDRQELFVLEENYEMKSNQLSIYSDKENVQKETGKESTQSGETGEEHLSVNSCCRLHELVVGRNPNWIFFSDNDDTTVCKYCREEVKNCYYDGHLVRCSGYKTVCKKSNHLLMCYKNDQECKTLTEQFSEETEENCTFIVSCIAVQASD